MKRIMILGALATMIGCGGSGGSDDGYVMPQTLDAVPDAPLVEPAPPPEPEPVCITLVWELPDMREDEGPFEHTEIAYVLVVIEDTYTLELAEATAALTSKDTGVERLEQGDPAVLQFPPGTTSVDCDEMGLGEDNYEYWFAVMVVDHEGAASQFSDLVRPEFSEEE